MESFELEVLSPAGLAAKATVTEVVLPAWNGEVGILPEHVSYTGLLGTGVLRFRSPTGGKEQSLVVSEGFCVFEQDTLKVLADRILVPESFAAQHGGTSGALSFAKQRSGELEASLSTLTVGSHEWSDAEQELKSLRAMEQCLHSH